MNLIELNLPSVDCPPALKTRLGAGRYARVMACGNLDHLRGHLLALFCSSRCPGRLILDTYDLAQALRDAGVAVIGGFHSPMEKECLDILLRGKQPVIVCPARSVERMRIPPAWKLSLAGGRLLILSPFAEHCRRITASLAVERNGFAAMIANELLITHASPGSKTERFCQAQVAAGKRVLTLNATENANLIAIGVQPTSVIDLTHSLSMRTSSA